MTPVRKADPAVVAAVSARATARHAHHEAGHAVAAVARGWKLIAVWLGTVDWSKDSSSDTSGGTLHRTPYADQPVVTFAGPWAEAMWTVEHDDDVDDFYEALEYAWSESYDGDAIKYDSRIDELCLRYGSSPIERAWEVEWVDDLDPLWPAVCEVAAMLVDGQSVTHEDVLAAVNRCRSD